MKPTDIAHLVTLGRPTLSPDGTQVVVAATSPDLGADDYRSSLWIMPADGSSHARRLTHGEHDSAAQFSPDGRWIAFLRATGADKPQLHLLPTGGGDARPITDLRGGAGTPVWAPDSSALAFCARVPDEGRYDSKKPGSDEKVPAGKEAPRRVTGLQYRLDGIGFTVDQRSHVFVVAVDAGANGEPPAPEQISEGDYEHNDVAWSPDGSALAFISARHDRREHDRCTDVFLVRRDGTDRRQLTDTTLWLSAPAFTPDGATLLACGQDPASGVIANLGVWSIAVSTPGRPRRLTDEESVHLSTERIVVDHNRALVVVENRGADDLLAVPLDGSEPAVVAAGRRRIHDVEVAAGTTVVTFDDPTTPGEVAALASDGFTPLTDFAAPLRETGRTVAIEEVRTSAPDGYPVHGLLALPAGDGPHPVLLMIHGGPFTQYGWGLFDEAQVYAGAGYAVVYGNPRGSSGYGQAHGQWIVGDVGDRSTPDLLALLDAALERPNLDPARVGVLGGSHGGYMTSWLLGHTDRFRAGVSERAVNAIDSFEGSSDIGWDFADQLYGTDPDERHRQSPLTYADQIHTPLLIVHSEHDWRCPIEQGQRLYVSLRKRDAVVELLIFPGEGHELSRSGVPSHRIARFAAILDWFARHIP
jgi:dipeptidyl aminopeptidase/acylaminoacyl peptidase